MPDKIMIEVSYALPKKQIITSSGHINLIGEKYD